MQNAKKWQVAIGCVGILAIIFLILIFTGVISFSGESKQTGLSVSGSSSSTQLSNDHKNKITKYVDACIPTQYKGENFRIDITTSSETAKPMVSFQLHDESSSKFEDKLKCMEAVKQIYTQLLKNEAYSTIQTFQFAFIPASGNMTYFIDIDDTSKITSIEELETHADIQQS